MGYIEKTFDLKKFIRVMKKSPDETESLRGPETLSPEDLNPCLLPAYTQILREGVVTIAGLDFGGISVGDIDDLENVLRYSPANRLFSISEVFIGFEPAAASVKRAFI